MRLNYIVLNLLDMEKVQKLNIELKIKMEFIIIYLLVDHLLGIILFKI